MTFKEFQETLKKLDTFKLRRGKKLFALVNVTRETATLTEVGSTKNMDVPTKMLYEAFKDLGEQGECTTKDLTPYVQSTAAPACAALLNSVFDVEIDEELGRVTNEIENTYQELLDLFVSDDFLFEPSGSDLEPTSYKKALGEMNSNMLEQEAFLLGMPSTIKATRASSMKKMQQDIYKFVTQHPEEWLLGLPMRDLYLLQEMVNGKLVRVDYSHTPPTLNWLRIVMDTAIDGKEGEYIAIYDDLKEALQPLIRPTIIAKLTLAEFTLETLLGVLKNTVKLGGNQGDVDAGRWRGRSGAGGLADEPDQGRIHHLLPGTGRRGSGYGPAQGSGVKTTFRIHHHGWHPGHEGAHEHLQPGHVVGGQGQHPSSWPAEPGVGGTGGGDQGLHARAHQPPGAGGGTGCAQDNVNAGPGPQQPPQVGAELGVRRIRSCHVRRTRRAQSHRIRRTWSHCARRARSHCIRRGGGCR